MNPFTLLLANLITENDKITDHFIKFNDMINDLMDLGIDEDKAIEYVSKHLDFSPVMEALEETTIERLNEKRETKEDSIDDMIRKIFDL